jgi:hypothetical protein
MSTQPTFLSPLPTERSGFFVSIFPSRAPEPIAPPAGQPLLGCCHHHDSFNKQNAIMIGLLQRLLSKFEEHYGLPKGDPFSFSQSSPAQNTNYTSTPVAYNGVIRGLIIAGKSNVTLSISTNETSTLLTQICKLPCAGGALTIPFHIRVPNNATFTISTDDASGTGIVSVAAWIEPIALTGEEHYRVRR